MAETVLEVEDISKLYRLGNIGTGSFRQDVQYWWNKKVLKREDPFFKGFGFPQGERKDYIWALKDVSFHLKQGESLGIIGSNGSGKSTLLKIISRIIQPTKGVVRGRGKVNSILEVGTGFNNELSGRENIYVSGYLMGMSKSEIRRKFDEIVAFSGIEKFIDTPVKRYSSGMYMRLAFAVAAHLEPDILIVDEVLAVGDGDFQRKCMGKMQEVSSVRTVLFVSHNLQAVSNLCSTALWLDKGKMLAFGHAKDVCGRYTSSQKAIVNRQNWQDKTSAPGNEFVRMKSIEVKPIHTDKKYITVHTPIEIEMVFWCLQEDFDLNINVELFADSGEYIFSMGTPSVKAEPSEFVLKSVIPSHLLNNRTYFISLTIVKNHSVHLHSFSNCISFDVEDVREGISYYGKWPGVIRPPMENSLFKKRAVVTQ